jgi:hypothetical protein
VDITASRPFGGFEIEARWAFEDRSSTYTVYFQSPPFHPPISLGVKIPRASSNE